MKYIFLFSLLAIVSCNSKTNKKQDNNSSTIKKDSVAAKPQFTIITVDLESVNLIIDSSSTDKVNIVKGYNEKEVTYQETISGNEIEIVSKGKESIVDNAGKIELQVPKKSIIICKLMSGDLKVNKINCESITVDAMSGDIKIKNATTSKAKFKTMSGNISFNGKIDNGKITLSSMSGNVNIFLDKESDVKLELESEKSNVSLDDNLTKQNPLTKTLKNGQGFLSAHSISGDVDCYTQ